MAGNVPCLGKRYIDKYKYFEGKAKLSGTAAYRLATENEVQEFLSILRISPAFTYYLGLTESADQFFKAFHNLSEMYEPAVREDLFFTAKLGKRFKMVPSKLFYILQKAVGSYKYPNLALSSIPDKLLAEFCCDGALMDISILDVLCNICKSEIKVLSPYRRRSQFGDCVELYVQDTVDGELCDRIALIPIELSDVLTDREVTNVAFDSKKGLVSDDLILRTLAGHAGITFYDFDLREVL